MANKKPTKQIKFWQAAWTDPLEPIIMCIGMGTAPIFTILFILNCGTAKGIDFACWLFALLLPYVLWFACWRSIWKKQNSINNGIIPFDSFFRDNPNLGYYPEDKK